jgi:hypothetical protein
VRAGVAVATAPPSVDFVKTRVAVWIGAVVVAVTGSCGGEEPEPVNTGPSVIKFCHQFHRSGNDIDLTLTFGQPAKLMTARTGTCFPVAGTPCSELPLGKVQMKVLEGERTLIKATVPVKGGVEYLAYPVVSALGDLAIRVVPMPRNEHCDTANPLPALKPPGGQ